MEDAYYKKKTSSMEPVSQRENSQSYESVDLVCYNVDWTFSFFGSISLLSGLFTGKDNRRWTHNVALVRCTLNYLVVRQTIIETNIQTY